MLAERTSELDRAAQRLAACERDVADREELLARRAIEVRRRWECTVLLVAPLRAGSVLRAIRVSWHGIWAQRPPERGTGNPAWPDPLATVTHARRRLNKMSAP